MIETEETQSYVKMVEILVRFVGFVVVFCFCLKWNVMEDLEGWLREEGRR